LIFVTKYRQEISTEEHLELMRKVFAGLCINYQAELVKFDGEVDHVHLPPQAQLSKLKFNTAGLGYKYNISYFACKIFFQLFFSANY
jgi:putative transposase